VGDDEHAPGVLELIAHIGDTLICRFVAERALLNAALVPDGAPPHLGDRRSLAGAVRRMRLQYSEATDEGIADAGDEVVHRGAVHRFWLDRQAVHPQLGISARCVEVDWTPWWRDGDFEHAEVSRTLELAGSLAERRDCGGGLLQVQGKAVPAVRVLDGAPVRGRRLPADHNGRVRLLDRTWPLDHVVEADEAIRERGRGRRPQHAHDRQVLVGTGTAIGKRCAKRAQLCFNIADRDADDQPPFRERIEGRELPDQQHRLALRQNDHADPQPHPVCQCAI
jgi:hypothetical protein